MIDAGSRLVPPGSLIGHGVGIRTACYRDALNGGRSFTDDLAALSGQSAAADVAIERGRARGTWAVLHQAAVTVIDHSIATSDAQRAATAAMVRMILRRPSSASASEMRAHGRRPARIGPAPRVGLG